MVMIIISFYKSKVLFSEHPIRIGMDKVIDSTSAILDIILGLRKEPNKSFCKTHLSFPDNGSGHHVS